MNFLALTDSASILPMCVMGLMIAWITQMNDMVSDANTYMATKHTSKIRNETKSAWLFLITLEWQL